MRPSGRLYNQLRSIKITREFTKHAEGSVLVEFGDTKVLCTASIEETVPRFLKGSGKGWVTAEYGMLPRSTHTRNQREASGGKQGGRTLEIQRLIGRSLRSMVNLAKMGETCITVDCDVIQADGGTRTAAITGGAVALVDALTWMLNNKKCKEDPLNRLVSAISVGIFKGQPVLDLDYQEDCIAETDMNVVITQHGSLIEVQGTAEAEPFSNDQLSEMVNLAVEGSKRITQIQQEALNW